MNCINIKDYGAIGDGIADNTIAFREIIERWKNKEFDEIYLGESTDTFIVGECLFFDGNSINNSRLVIISNGAVLKAADSMLNTGVPADVIQIRDVDYFKIEGLEIDGNRNVRGFTGGASAHGIKLYGNIKFGEISNCEIYNCPLDCICASSGNDKAPQNITIRNNKLTDWQRSGISVIWGDNFTIDNNYFDNSLNAINSNGGAINLEPNTTPLTNNIDGVVIKNNFLTNTNYFFQLGGRKDIGDKKDVRNVIISNNIAKNFANILEGTMYLFNINYAENVTISDNLFSGYIDNTRFFSFYLSRNVKINNNQFLSNGSNGLFLYGTIENLIFNDNKVLNEGVAFNLKSESENNIIKSNEFIGCKSLAAYANKAKILDNTIIGTIERPFDYIYLSGNDCSIIGNNISGYVNLGTHGTIKTIGSKCLINSNTLNITVINSGGKNGIEYNYTTRQVSGNLINIENTTTEVHDYLRGKNSNGEMISILYLPNDLDFLNVDVSNNVLSNEISTLIMK